MAILAGPGFCGQHRGTLWRTGITADVKPVLRSRRVLRGAGIRQRDRRARVCTDGIITHQARVDRLATPSRTLSAVTLGPQRPAVAALLEFDRATSLTPSTHSPNQWIDIQKTAAHKFQRHCASASAIPTPMAKPCPRGPVVHSTPRVKPCKNRSQRAYAMGAAPRGNTGCPELAFSTSSTARKRSVLTQS